MGLKASIAHTHLLLERARAAGINRLAVFVSSGKDSVCTLDLVHKSGIPYTAIHQYLVAGLRINEDVLEPLEKRYGISIVRIPSGARVRMFANDVLRIQHVWESGDKMTVDHTAQERFACSIAKTPWMALGVKKVDSPTRFLALDRSQNPNPKTHKFYPIAEWKHAECWEYIKAEGLPVSRAYELFGRSLDSIDIKHVYPLKHAMPDDYAKVLNDFPLMEPLVWLYERRVRANGFNSLPEC